MSDTESSVSLHQRALARPEAEEARRHDRRKAGEASLPALGKTLASSQHLSSAIPQGMGGEAELSAPDDDLPDESASSAATSAETEIEIIRATTRFALDLRILSPVQPKNAKRELSVEEKDVRRALEETSRMATTARNAAMRFLVARDGGALDGYLKEHGGVFPKKKEDLTYPKNYSYPLIRATTPRIASGMAATIAREVDRKWAGERFECLVWQTRSPPHYRVGQPFPVRQQDVTWVWSTEQRRATAIVSLFAPSDGGPTKFRLPIEARDHHQALILKKLASGEWKTGELKIERDRLRPAKWYLRVAYKRKVPLRLQGQAAAICLGMRHFLVAVCADGQEWVYDGEDIATYLRRTQARRQSRQRQTKASARVGRGRPAALKSIEHLAGKAQRYRETRCAVIARRVATWLRERGVNRVYLSDFTAIRDAPPETLAFGNDFRKQWIWERVQEWPYYLLSQKIKSALEAPSEGERCQEAIVTYPLEQDFHSQRCPKCGHVEGKNRDLRNWVLRCQKCNFRRHLDVAQCKNSLERASGKAMPNRDV